MSGVATDPNSPRVGEFPLRDVLRYGLGAYNVRDDAADELVDAYLELVRAPSHIGEPEPDEPVYAMAYLPARAVAALSNALALTIRHAIDDRDTIGELAGMSLANVESLKRLFTHAQGLEERVDRLEKRSAPRTRKAA